jgi:hypothetical protein
MAPALAPASEPVIAEVEAVGRPRGGNKLQDRERNAAGVYLLEYEADGFLRGFLFQLDDGQRVVAERLENLLAELHEPREFIAVRLDERVLPLARVENLVARKVKRLDLLVTRA